MSKFENDYRQLLEDILNNGSISENRTGIETLKLFNKSMTIDLKDGFPIVTGKLVDFDCGKTEFEWIMKGSTNTDFLNKRGVAWWNQFADENGDLGKIYGYQMRMFDGVFDQYEYVVNQIRQNSRRAVITFWNPCDLEEQSLPCCYTSFIFVRDNNELNMLMNFRSSDTFLGLPYDIIMGSLMLLNVAKRTGLRARFLGLSLADAHIYANHIEPVKKYLQTKNYALPVYNDVAERILNYKSGPYIQAKLNV